MAIVSANGAATPLSPNYIINGAFDINQRGFTSVTTNAAFGFDRWKNSVGTGGGTNTMTPQVFTVGSSSIFGFEATNYLRIASASQSTVNDWAGIQTSLEDVRTLAGQTATLSFWARASSGTPVIAATLEQSFGTGGSASVRANSSNIAINTNWTRYSITLNIPSISGKTIGTNHALNVFIFTSMGATLVAAGYPNVGLQNATVEFFGMQLEAGSIATPFRRNANSIQGELAACQRYYTRYTPVPGSGPYISLGMGRVVSTTGAYTTIFLPVPMRIPPVLAYSSISHFGLVTSSDGVAQCNGISIANVGNHNMAPRLVATVPSGLTAGNATELVTYAASGTSYWLDFSAEL